jgi:hypothetical protein
MQSLPKLMQICFYKLSDDTHALEVTRDDGQTERVELNSRSFLRHDLAHFAIELELSLRRGYWGSVAAGAALRGDDIDSDEIMLAERLAGPVQTLIRTEADVADYLSILRIAETELIDIGWAATDLAGLAQRIHGRVRQLMGHWRATPYGGAMQLIWQV